jgi:uncharacterized protein YukE
MPAKAPAEPAHEHLLKQAIEAADQGTDALAAFWDGALTKAQRIRMKDELADLKRLAEIADDQRKATSPDLNSAREADYAAGHAAAERARQEEPPPSEPERDAIKGLVGP